MATPRNALLVLVALVLTLVMAAPAVEGDSESGPIPDCTTGEIRGLTQFLAMSVFPQLDDVQSELSLARRPSDLEDAYDAALRMHVSWYAFSETLPRCTQVVDVRLLVDRMIESTMMAVVLTHNDDTTNAEIYTFLMEKAVEELASE